MNLFALMCLDPGRYLTNHVRSTSWVRLAMDTFIARIQVFADLDIVALEEGTFVTAADEEIPTAGT